MPTLAIDLGGTAIKFGVFADDGTLLRQSEEPTHAQQGAKAVVETLLHIIAAQQDALRVGLSCTGQVDARTGSIVFATDAMPGFTGLPLKALLEKRCGLPVAIDNDSNCAAIGEGQFGAARGFAHYLCLTYGTGIGAGIVLDGKIWHGVRGIAGETGHMITHVGGLPCVCGRRGCYEMYGSTNALIERVMARCGVRLTGRDIFDRFADPAVRSEIDQWIDEIVAGLVTLTHVFNPQCFVLGGGVTAQAYVVEAVRTRLLASVIPSFANLEVRQAEIGNWAGVYGAYSLAVNGQI